MLLTCPADEHASTRLRARDGGERSRGDAEPGRGRGPGDGGGRHECFSRYCELLICPSPDAEPERVLELLLAEGERLERPLSCSQRTTPLSA